MSYITIIAKGPLGPKVCLVDAEDYDKVKNIKIRYRIRNGCVRGTRCQIGKKRISVGKFILDYQSDLQIVDHINHDPLDNRKQNLRLVTHQQSNFNRRMHRNNACGYKGVFITNKRYFSASITFNRTQIILGRHFPDAISAAKVYDAKAKELFGEYACFNLPEQAS
jgi:hypothetical protein